LAFVVLGSIKRIGTHAAKGSGHPVRPQAGPAISAAFIYTASQAQKTLGPVDMFVSGNEIYERQVGICKAFANPTRLRILDMIATHDETGTSLQRKLGVSTANLSQHLAVLKAAGVVVTRREGKNVHCSLAIPEVKQACTSSATYCGRSSAADGDSASSPGCDLRHRAGGHRGGKLNQFRSCEND